MAKKRVTLKFIENERARKSSYKRRIEALRKKFSELCTLCDIKSCIIVYSPDFEEPFIWPSSEETKELLAKYESLSKFHQTKKMVNNEQYVQCRIEKLKEEVSKHMSKNKKMEACILMHKILNNGRGMQEIMRYEDVELLKWYSMEKIQEVQHYKRCFPPLP
ncbi:hypothetical protein RND81_08G162100 [Saponaria officinalis]|uniref:MADS-box domain-containing protein n=1 Tax=Saponaria officinalis TaxID=3572 RepID=A0AAW1J939_SAPOF